ncbi:MAG: DUF4145 domain-containing protein [bacterium]|nr:DUF4145 domain-containing protein [bacterium]
MSEGDIISAPCRRCVGPTRHQILAVTQVDETEEYNGTVHVVVRATYRMIQCRGCETVTLMEHEQYGSCGGDGETYYYPAPPVRRVPDWHVRLTAFDGGMRALLVEVYSAMRADNRRLALMGVRGVVDLLLSDKVAGSGGFKARLDRLEGDGHISHANGLVLNAVLEAGHAAAHRGYQPSVADLGLVLDIVENVLQSVYVLGADGAVLGKAVPRRVE